MSPKKGIGALQHPPRPQTLSEAKDACKRAGIRNSTEYKRRHGQFGLPAHPERVYSDEWRSYVDFFDIPELISYKDLKSQARAQGVMSKKEYTQWVRSLDSRAYPLAPEEAYPDEWENWYDFCGKERPYKPKYISKPYRAWAEKIDTFMRQAAGGSSKETQLCRFVRLFIEKHDKSKAPEEFLAKKKVHIKPLKNELDSLKTDNARRSLILAVNEFLDFIITHDLTIEDEDTGEIVRIMDARNPLALLLNDKAVTTPQRSETTKPCLQYYFVKKARDWIIPKSARTFRNLAHLQQFDTDWVKIKRTLIDPSDPDCIHTTFGNHYYIWSPVDWIHTYTLAMVPLRGRQIAYNDSGEADKEIADLDDQGNIAWINNPSPLAGKLNKQSFIKKMADGSPGMFVTTNKTSNQGAGYSIPWMPEELAYWLIRLRKWQQKYNPISQPTPWTACQRTNLNEVQLKAKGANCFLFRSFGQAEPKNPTQALTPRLAAALFNVQPQDLALATVNGSRTHLSNYKSAYTPHSMRVSLITAYVVDGGLPPAVVMKVVGHSSIVMTIYYCKFSHGQIRERFDEAEKRMLKSQAEATQKTIEQNRIEAVKNQLVGSSSDLLRSLTNSVPAGNYVFRDYGICPYAASRCDDGGDLIGATGLHRPVASGHLGSQNCLQCRHFITGPAFLGGLIAISNEIQLEAKQYSYHYSEIQDKIDLIERELDELDRQEHIADAKGISFDTTKRQRSETELRRLASVHESSAKKMDSLLCDLQSAYRHIRNCQSLTHDKDDFALIRSSEGELRIEVEETPYFEQLHEICENANFIHFIFSVSW